MTEFLNLNDDCLEHVFRFVDLKTMCAISETCKRLKEIAEGIFRRHHRYYECNIGEKENVKEAANIIRKVGQHLTDLSLTFERVDSELYLESGIGCQFLLELNCLLGDKFRTLTLYGQISSIPVLSLRLAPTFLKLEQLTISNEIEPEGYKVLFIDLPQLCPNLRVLRIECALIIAPNSKKSFQKLEVLEFMSMGPYYPTEWFQSFIQDNKQLKTLYVNNIDGEILNTSIDLTVVTKNLKDLEDLRIRTVIFENVPAAISDLKELHHLTTLVLTEYWDDAEQLNVVLGILKSITQLKHLWIGNCLHGWTPINQQSVVDIARNLKILESFECHDIECKLDTITAFVRFGRNLKRLSAELDEVVTVAFIEGLSNVRELAAGQQSPLSIHFDNTLSSDVKQVRRSSHTDFRKFFQKI